MNSTAQRQDKSRDQAIRKPASAAEIHKSLISWRVHCAADVCLFACEIAMSRTGQDRLAGDFPPWVQSLAHQRCLDLGKSYLRASSER
jgi:hypothetical protein